jgi:hypothetical protein
LSWHDPRFQKGLDPTSAKQVLEFLFGKDGEGKFLDMRTDIKDKNTFKTLTYYRLLEEHFESKAAGKIANILERLSLSNERMSRLEGVAVLRQEMPKVETVVRGVSPELETKEEE